MRSAEAPLLYQASKELAAGVGGDQLWACLVGVPKAGHVNRDDAPEGLHLVPDPPERPKGFRPRGEHQEGGVRLCLGVRVAHAHPVANSEIGGDRSWLSAHLNLRSDKKRVVAAFVP